MTCTELDRTLIGCAYDHRLRLCDRCSYGKKKKATDEKNSNRSK